ncbi:hypothetical protein LY78DRAFT_655064 [Colletotrichum sublineola]|nr:hypothetical protein LY78DRAFT_655064 [Colletotrichum sublineola]
MPQEKVRLLPLVSFRLASLSSQPESGVMDAATASEDTHYLTMSCPSLRHIMFFPPSSDLRLPSFVLYRRLLSLASRNSEAVSTAIRSFLLMFFLLF